MEFYYKVFLKVSHKLKENICDSLFRPAILVKRDSNTGEQILQNFQNVRNTVFLLIFLKIFWNIEKAEWLFFPHWILVESLELEPVNYVFG